jgi:cob(I)alamin adenosyltransferase
VLRQERLDVERTASVPACSAIFTTGPALLTWRPDAHLNRQGVIPERSPSPVPRLRRYPLSTITRVRIYTRRGDDGTTGLHFGGRVPKDSPRIDLTGSADEAQAAIGLARAEFDRESAANQLLVQIARHLYVLMAEASTAPENRRKLQAGSTLVSKEMVKWLEDRIDELTRRTNLPNEFVIPGDNRRSATLDLARTAVRRAERAALAIPEEDSAIGVYLNRLSDLLWVMARAEEDPEARPLARHHDAKPSSP